MSLPPIHPALVHFPIALITLSVIAEFIGYFWKSEAARRVAWWTLVGAVVGVAVTVPAGYSDMWRASLAPETHRLVEMHMKTGWIVATGFVVLIAWRWFIRSQAERQPGGGYLTAATIVFALTMFQGWYGGEMVFAHGAGVAAAGQGVRPPERAKATLPAVAETLRKLPLLGSKKKGHHGGGGEKSGHAETQSGSPPPPASSGQPAPPPQSPPPSQPPAATQPPPASEPASASVPAPVNEPAPAAQPPPAATPPQPEPTGHEHPGGA